MSPALTLEQSRAVTRTGQDVCVVAGPGSGKTRVLIHRFAWLIEQGIAPSRILAITYTEKAAGEIKQRLVEHFRTQPALQQKIERAAVSTVHGFCARLLREHAIAAQLDPDFVILDERRSRAELAAATLEALDDAFHRKPHEFAELLNGWSAHSPTTALVDVYKQLRVSGEPLAVTLAPHPIDSRQVFGQLFAAVENLLAATRDLTTKAQQAKQDAAREWLQRARHLSEPPIAVANFTTLADFSFSKQGIKRDHPAYDLIDSVRDELLPRALQYLLAAYYEPQLSLLRESLSRMDHHYRERKARRNALDFDDLEERAIRLLESSTAVRHAVQHSFDHILMDELQDTNPLQWRLLELIRQPNRFFGVGDVNQSIYGFRHADPQVFTDYREALLRGGNTVDRLQDNYRSRPAVLQAVNIILGHGAGIERHQLQPQGTFPGKGEPAVEVTAALAADTLTASQIEAAWIAARIRELHGTLLVGSTGRPAAFSDMAILVRTSESLLLLEMALQEFGIPYIASRGKTFFEESEVVDILNALRILANGADEVSLLAVLRSPLVGISDESIFRLWREHKRGLAAALDAWTGDSSSFDSEDSQRLRDFRTLYQSLRLRIDDVPPEELLQQLIDASDYESTLPPSARANIEKLLVLIRDASNGGAATLADVAADLDAQRDARQEANAPPVGKRDAVHLGTMHGSKGLEWPVVFLAALQRPPRSTPPPLTYSPHAGLGAIWRVPGSDKDKKESDPPHELWKQTTGRRERAESDRLLYVAMTRAEEHLVMSYTSTPSGREGPWPEIIEIGLGLRIEGPQPPSVVQTPEGLPIRWQVTSHLRTNDFPVIEGELPIVEPQVVPQAASTPATLAHLTLEQIRRIRLCPRQSSLFEIFGDAPALPAEFGEELVRYSALAPGLGAATEWKRDFRLVIAWRQTLVEGTIDVWWKEAGGGTVLVALTTDPVLAQLQTLLCQRWRPEPLNELYYINGGVLTALTPDAAIAEQALADVTSAASAYHYPAQPGATCAACSFASQLCPDAQVS